jgi:two-component system, LytTR family, response regulator
MVFGGLYIITDSLYIPIGLHFAYDFYGILIKCGDSLLFNFKSVFIFDIEIINILINYLDKILESKEESKNIIIGRCQEDELKVLSDDYIYYFEAMGNDVFYMTKDKKYNVEEKLYELEERLEVKGFIRVSKCFVVNIVKVDRIISWFNSKLMLKLIDINEEVYVTRKYLSNLKKYIGL